MNAYKYFLLNQLKLNRDIIYYIKQIIDLKTFTAPSYDELKLFYQNYKYTKDGFCFSNDYCQTLVGNCDLKATYIDIKNNKINHIQYLYQNIYYTMERIKFKIDVFHINLKMYSITLELKEDNLYSKLPGFRKYNNFYNPMDYSEDTILPDGLYKTNGKVLFYY